MSELRKRFRELMGQGLDISEHLGLLYGLAASPHVLTIGEIGFRSGVSTTALALAGKPVFSIDIAPIKKHVQWFAQHAKHVNVLTGDSLKVDPIKCDLLLIDGEHTYTQVSKELARWSPSVGRWIALHDVETFGDVGRDKKKLGLKKAIDEFIDANDEWTIQIWLKNNNGMAVLQRVSDKKS